MDQGHSGLTLTVADLKSTATWIRDDLEPRIAYHGPAYLSADATITLITFLSRLARDCRRQKITYEGVRRSRINRALLLITGTGTRWPEKLVDVADETVDVMTEILGPLKMIPPLLFEKGGRLEGVESQIIGDGRHALLVQWMSDPHSRFSPLRALEHGHIGFEPGQSVPLFLRGIIDNPDGIGGITSDCDGAYAILMTGEDELDSQDSGLTIYRCRSNDMGRYRLMGAMLPPKAPVRLLRSHTLHSIWSPRAGVRYEGLYRVVHYQLRLTYAQVIVDVTLQREDGQEPIGRVIRHPLADECEDFEEFRRLRKQQRLRSQQIEALGIEENPFTVAFGAFNQGTAPVSPGKRAALEESEMISPKTPLPGGSRNRPQTPDFDYDGVSEARETHDPFMCKTTPKDVDPDEVSEPYLQKTSSRYTCSTPSLHTSPSPVPFSKYGRNETLTRRPRQGALIGPVRLSSGALSLSPTLVAHNEYSSLGGRHARKDSGYPDSHRYSETMGSLDDFIEDERHGALASMFSNAATSGPQALDTLSENTALLKASVLRRRSLGASFRHDILQIKKAVREWQRQMVSECGSIDHRLTALESDLAIISDSTDVMEYPSGEGKDLTFVNAPLV